MTQKFSLFGALTVGIVALCAALAPIGSQQPPALPLAKVINGNPPLPVIQIKQAHRKHHHGRKVDPARVARRHADAFSRHGYKMNKIKDVTIATYSVLSAALPVNDQGQCGDCFMISALDACSAANAKSGYFTGPLEQFRLSGQYGLDCQGSFGGCDGGDEVQIIDFVKTNGWVLTSAYGPYTQSGGKCKPITGMQVVKIADWGYCTPGQQQGAASTQDMKNAMYFYGTPLSVAFDASECDGYTNGTMTGRGTNVDHAVLCVGWDDTHDNGDGSKGAFLGLNQWGAWGINNTGTFWVKYGADSWGTEAAWILGIGGNSPPVPPVPPTPPGPTPPVPPLGLTILTISGAPLPIGDYQLAPKGSESFPAGTTAKMQQAAELWNQILSQQTGKCYNRGGCTCGCVESGKCKCKDCNNPMQKQASAPIVPCCQPPMIPQVAAQQTPMQKMP